MLRVGWTLLGISLLWIMYSAAGPLFLAAVGFVLQPFICVGIFAIIGIPTYLLTRGMVVDSELEQEDRDDSDPERRIHRESNL